MPTVLLPVLTTQKLNCNIGIVYSWQRSVFFTRKAPLHGFVTTQGSELTPLRGVYQMHTLEDHRRGGLPLYILTHTLPGFLLSKRKWFSFNPLRALYLKYSSAQLYVGTNTSLFFICFAMSMVDFCILHPQCCLENQLQSSKMFLEHPKRQYSENLVCPTTLNEMVVMVPCSPPRTC